MATDTIHHKETDHSPTDNASWEGGEYPFKVGYGKLMIWYFLLSDAFTFAGFLISYGTLRFSMPTWPVPDFVFSTFPFLGANNPLLFVTLMTFVLLFSSFTMIRAVQEGHRENRAGVVKWMSLTILGGLGFLGCQAWEWTTLIGAEHMSVSTNPFGTHTEAGIYLGPDGKETDETFDAGNSYLMHKINFQTEDHLEETGDAGHEGSGIIDLAHAGAVTPNAPGDIIADHANPKNKPDAASAGDTSVGSEGETAVHPDVKEEIVAREGGAPGEGTGPKTEEETAEHADEADGHGGHQYAAPGDYPDAVVDERGFIHRKYIVTSGESAGMVKAEEFGPKAFGALFFFITGFHGFHVFSGVIFLLIIMINVMSGIYVARRNKNEMVEKIGLYWHFVDLVWVFVFLVFYLL